MMADPSDGGARFKPGAWVKRLREDRGWTQQDLAEQLGAAVSWVSQVEKGTLPPGDARRALLESVLGLREGALAGDRESGAYPSSQEVIDPEALFFPMLWRARADLVDRMTLKTESRESRARLYYLHEQLLSAAASHPRASQFSSAGRLQPLRQIAEDAPAWLRWMVLVELAGMKIDAPFDCRLSRAHQKDLLERIAIDLELTEADDAVRRGFACLKRSWPDWRDLKSTGGPLGLITSLRSEESDSLRILLGDDPSGWLGYHFATGAWLVREADSNTETQETTVGEGSLPPRPSQLLTATGLGVVAGPAIGSVLGMALMATTARAQARRRTAAPKGASADLPPGVATTARIAMALGRHWVRVDAHKLAALYVASADTFLEANVDAALPSRQVAYAHIAALHKHFGSLAEEEAKASGTRTKEHNEPLWEMLDIRDTLKVLADVLRP